MLVKQGFLTFSAHRVPHIALSQKGDQAQRQDASQKGTAVDILRPSSRTLTCDVKAFFSGKEFSFSADKNVEC